MKPFGFVTKPLAAAVAGLMILALAACASTPKAAFEPWAATISDPGEIYSTLEWRPELVAALTSAGREKELDAIKAHYTEPGWPAKLASFDARQDGRDTIRLYKVEVITQFRFNNNDAVLLHVPAKTNQHMPEGWKPKEDFYIAIRSTGVARAG
jgi:hypothetical protein